MKTVPGIFAVIAIAVACTTQCPYCLDVHTRAAEDRLRLALGTRVRIVRKGPRGRIEIDFGSENELIRVFEQLTGDQ